MSGLVTGLYTVMIVGALVAFGRGYDDMVESWDRDVEGFEWLAVAGWVLVTLAGLSALDLYLDYNAGLLGLMAFGSSGFFMVLGSVRRYVVARRRLKELFRDDAQKPLAE